MSTNFPTSLDSYTNPTATDTLDGVPHHSQHANANDAIVQIETKIGTGSSTPSAGKVFRATGTGTSGWGQVAAGEYAAGSIVNADISASAAIAYSKLSLSASIVNADVSASAAIAASKISVGTFGGSGKTTLPGLLTINGSSTQAFNAKTITLAAGATGAVLDVNAPYAFLFVAETAATGQIAIYAVTGGAATVFEVYDPSAVYGTTSGASTYNIYWSGANSRYEIQNNSAGSRTFQILAIGLNNY